VSAAEQVIATLRGKGATAATAESLTGGLVCARLVDVPGASEVVRGAVVAYAADLKSDLLGVDVDHLGEYGTVDARTAEQMATGVCARLGPSYGGATTGVAGPESSEGKPPGTVHIAVAGPAGSLVRSLNLSGSRTEIRLATVDAALSLLMSTVV